MDKARNTAQRLGTKQGTQPKVFNAHPLVRVEITPHWGRALLGTSGSGSLRHLAHLGLAVLDSLLLRISWERHWVSAAPSALEKPLTFPSPSAGLGLQQPHTVLIPWQG